MTSLAQPGDNESTDPQDVPANPQDAVERPRCQLCGETANWHNVRENRGIMLGDYHCVQGHIWFTKWLVAA